MPETQDQLTLKVAELDKSNEELGAALVVALRRLEMMKTVIEVMALQLGVDHDSLCARAARRMEAREKVSKEMEAEKGAKADA